MDPFFSPGRFLIQIQVKSAVPDTLLTASGDLKETMVLEHIFVEKFSKGQNQVNEELELRLLHI